MRLRGESITREQLQSSVGDISQIGGIRRSVLQEGRGAGTELIDIRTGDGFQFTVVPGRAFDIAWMEDCGRAVSFISKSGMASAPYYESEGAEWLRSFYAGMLTTCGLLNVGGGCEENGRQYRLHGRICNIPAEQVCTSAEWIGDDYVMKVSGKVRESCVFAENLLLKREITARMGEKGLTIRDTVENNAMTPSPFMILYHMNVGYPMLSEHSRILMSSRDIRPINQHSADHLKEIGEVQRPSAEYEEQGFLHTPACDNRHHTYIGIVNEKLGFGISLRFDVRKLPKWQLWKLLRNQDYVVGLEPYNGANNGYVNAKKEGALSYLQPGEKWESEIQLKLLTSKEEITGFEETVLALR